MHYYQHNIADYRKDTTHLSLLEHGIYRQLLDTYYLLESPLSADKNHLMRTHCVRSADEVQALKNVLDDFFELTDDGYIHSRCNAEISKILDKSEKARLSAKARWSTNKGKRNANAVRTHSEGNANGMLPNTHNPIPNKEKNKQKRTVFKPPTVEEVAEYCKERNNGIDPETFVSHYTANGWVRGKTKIKDWKACVRTWEKRNEKSGGSNQRTESAAARAHRRNKEAYERAIRKEREDAGIVGN